ncbi:adenylyl-sulfate kinase [Celerinatantimonas yamalensis]|uniref:Adenylyl-sulfate kinase n=1 Tax=Celerinatantimonas yamalensis TaxID=559956 RepID=A0ABW9G7X3_9GAMM
MQQVSQDVVWHQCAVSQPERNELNGHQSVLLWYTGLSGSGKSTIANAVDRKLYELGIHSYVLDGDNVRHGLNGDLEFSDQDRVENIRRISEVAKLMVDAGLVVSTAFISPFMTDRAQAKQLVGETRFIEIFIDTPLAVCEARDPKGLYRKARAGEIKHFTGIDSTYQAPIDADIHLATEQLSVEQCTNQVIQTLFKRKIITSMSCL